MKRKYIIALVICLLVLIGIIIGIVVTNNQKEDGNKKSDYTVHETGDDTVEEESENSLNESDSEDGPVLDEDNMIDFNGGDDDKDGDAEEPSEGVTENPEDSKETEEPEVPDTGMWGGFY